jgi:hypothetical protein
MVTVAENGSPGRGPQAAKPTNRRAKVLIGLGIAVLLVVVVGTLLLFGDGDDATTTPPGVAEGDDGSDWSLELAVVGAVTGVGSLVLGIADFVRNSLRYSRDRRRATADWPDPGGYL